MSAVLAQDALSTDEANALITYERKIERGLSVFVEVGEALTEIRDQKLYRASHSSFEAYCFERWEISKPRAYQLIDHARTWNAIDDAVAEAGGASWSTVVDVSERDTREIKADLPAVLSDIKTRVERGEAPQAAVTASIKAKRAEKDAARQSRVSEAADRAGATSKRRAKQAENDRIRDEARAKLPESIRVVEDIKATARKKALAETPETRAIAALEAQNSELREANAALTADLAAAKAENERWETMRVQFEQGGFEKVVEGLEEQVRVLSSQVALESQDKASWAKSSKAWRKRALKLGWSNDEIIDLSEGARV